MNINKIATKDAFQWARAEMFFGEGAGTRRKLLSNEIAWKVERVPGYQKAFEKAYNKQNMADHAIKAAKERKRLDRRKFIGKNAKAISRGDRRNIHPSILIGVGAAIVLHQTGYDKVLLEKAKDWYAEVESRVHARRENENRKNGLADAR